MSPTNQLSAEMVFFVIAVFRIIEFPLAMIPHLLAETIMVSMALPKGMKNLSVFIFSFPYQSSGYRTSSQHRREPKDKSCIRVLEQVRP